MLSKTTRIFNSPFHFYFDRDENFNCFVTFNIYEFLKNYATYPEIYDIEDFYNTVLESIKIDFYLSLDDKDSIRFHTEQLIKITNIQNIDLFNSNKVKTYLLNINTKNINRNYRVKGKISFSDKVYAYIQEFLAGNVDNILFADDKNSFLNIINLFKNIHEKKYYNYFNSFVPNSTYEFYSEVINFDKKSINISNLYEIFSTFISKESLTNFINTYESLKNVSYDGNLPINSFILDKQSYSLNYNVGKKIGSTENHLKLSISLLNDSKNRLEYKKYSYQNNLFLVDGLTKKKKNETQKTYEFIDSMQSTACEETILNNNKIPDLLNSDILLTATFLENYEILDLNEYWVENPGRIPVYLLEILTKYNILYLTNIDISTLDEQWDQLTKERLQDLNSGRYLCMISANQDYIQSNIIENYFVLEI